MGRPAGAADASVRVPRRWPWIVLAVVGLVAGGISVAVAADQRGTAAAWRDRAVAVEEQRDDASGRVTALQTQLDALAGDLTTSEADVQGLEDRLRTLAGEKAQTEDELVTGEVERDVLTELSVRVAEATSALDECVTHLFDLQQASVELFNASAAGQAVDVDPLNARSREVTGFCNDARTAVAEAAAAADAIGRGEPGGEKDP